MQTDMTEEQHKVIETNCLILFCYGDYCNDTISNYLTVICIQQNYTLQIYC